MTTESFPNTELAGANLEAGSVPQFHYPRLIPRHSLSLKWRLHQDVNPAPIAFGQVDFAEFVSRLDSLLKLQRQHREKLAAVSLDPDAQRLLSALDQETSIRWEDLPDRAGCDWSAASRSAALLAGANLCEASPTRIRLNEYGDKLLAESSSVGQAAPEVAS